MSREVPTELSDAAASALLSFYAESGVDCLLEDIAVDRFAESAEARALKTGPLPPPIEDAQGPAARRQSEPAGEASRFPAPASAPAMAPEAARPPAGVPDQEALKDARALAEAASSIADLRERLLSYEGCALRYSAKSLVFADGNPEADIMFVGEAPGRDEDIQGLPFVGRAGQMLDRMLSAIDLDRQKVYITNMLFWRPPGNRTPTPHEIALCRPFTERHIELANPKMIVFLGNVATKGMLETTKGILSLRGTWTEYRLKEASWPALPTLHPAYLLRNPAHKKLAWRDFLSLKARIGNET